MFIHTIAIPYQHDIVSYSAIDIFYGLYEQINVWFTGHSLGCATASLVYSSFLSTRRKQINLRDSYLFAAPIVSDQETVDGEPSF